MAVAAAITLAPATAAAQWTLTKTPSPPTYSSAGQVITYTYVLTNEYDTPGTVQSITDDKVSPVNCPTLMVPAEGTLTCTGTYTITAADITAGSVTNTAVVIGDSCNDNCDEAIQAQATIAFVAQPSWTLIKTPNPATYGGAGVQIAYTYVLTNTGSVDIGSIAIADDKIATVSCAVVVLTPGSSATCTGNYTTTAADVAAGSVTNHAVASGIPMSGTLADATAQATITFSPSAGSIRIVATASGGDGAFGFTSTLPGSTSFTLTTVNGQASRAFASVAPGTYTFTEASLPGGWNLAALTCTGDAGGTPTTVDFANRSASVGLNSGEAITCIFANAFSQKPRELIENFLARRTALLAAHEPDRSRLVRRLPGTLWGDEGLGSTPGPVSPFNLSGSTEGTSSRLSFATSLSQIAAARARAEVDDENAKRMALGMAASRNSRPVAAPRQTGVDVWVEGHFSRFEGDDRVSSSSGHFGLVYLGADYLLSPSLLVGALVQFDFTEESARHTTGSVEGDGWMAGPYVSARLAQNLFFDARAAWGTSDNTVNPFGTYEDDFSTDRWLAHAKLTGNWRIGDFRITPSAGMTYIEEDAKSYVDTLGTRIAGQTVSLGQVAFGPEFAYRYFTADGTVYEPHLSIKALWDFDKGGSVSTIGGLAVSDDEWRGRVEAGVLIRSASGFSMRAVATYDGIGSDGFEDIGGQLWLNVPFD